MLYVPEGYKNTTLPVMYVYPGNTQTDSIFMPPGSFSAIP